MLRIKKIMESIQIAFQFKNFKREIGFRNLFGEVYLGKKGRS